MKRSILMMLVGIFSCISHAHSGDTLKVYQGTCIQNFLLSNVDSITHDGGQFVSIYQDNQMSAYSIQNVDSIVIQPAPHKELPVCSTGEVVRKADRSAVVSCSYSGAEGFECGVMVSSDSDTKSFPTSSEDGERRVSLTGLFPATRYNYWAYIDVGGELISGEVKSFTTDLPDISGTWTCIEHHVRSNGSTYDTSYSLTLDADGKVQYSESSEIYASSWNLSADGTVNARVIDIYNNYNHNCSGKNWEGTIDNLKNPTKITGGTYRWNENQIGYYQGDTVQFEMTR